MAASDDAPPMEENPCLAKKAELKERHKKLTDEHHAHGARITAIRDRMREVRDAWPPDSPCYARAQTFDQDIEIWLSQSSPGWFPLETAILNTLGAINCNGTAAEIDAQIAAAELALKQMEEYLYQIDQTLGTHEAFASEITNDCPVRPA